MKPKIAIVRGKFLNKYEMQFYEPLTKEFELVGFGSLAPYHSSFSFPVIRLPSPMDLPDFPYKMPILNRMFTDAHYLWGLEQKLKGFDIVHSAETYFNFTQQSIHAKKLGFVKKVIATVLENIPFNNEGISGRKQFKKNSREYLDKIVALTNLTRNTLITEGMDPSKITIINHYIDTKRFTPVRINRKQNSIVIMFSGRMEVYKGVFDLLFMFKKLITDNDLKKYDLVLRMVGEGSQLGNLLNLEKEFAIERYVFHKSVSYDNMPQEYWNSDIFVAPSKSTKTWSEQYNTALLEAQASGLPIVTTKTGGIPENIGDGGILVEPGDIQGLYQQTKKFILNLKHRQFYAARARQRAIEHHDISIGARLLSALYKSLL